MVTTNNNDRIDTDEDQNFTPNAETLAALAEYDNMKKNHSAYKRYDSFDELLSEVLDDA